MSSVPVDDVFSDENYVLKGPVPLYEPGPGGIGYEIFHALNRNRGKIYQHIINTGESQTYDDLLEKSIETALYLSKRNLKSDDIVCLCSPNNLNSLIPFIASQFLGVIFSSIEPTLPENDLMYYLIYLKPKILFVHEEIESKIKTAVAKSNVECEVLVLGRQILKKLDGSSFSPIMKDNLMETAIIFLSSGTTGKPKGICCNHYGILGQSFTFFHNIVAKGIIQFSNFVYKYDNDDTNSTKFMFYSPMYWISGLIHSLPLMMSGFTRIIGSKFEDEQAWNALQKYQPEILFLPPGQVNELCLFADGKENKNFSLKTFIIGGGLVRKNDFDIVKRVFPNVMVVQIYGQTENTGPVATFDVKSPKDVELQILHPESCGKPITGFRYKVIDLNNEEVCGPGIRGELLVKNKYLMNGYYKMDSSFAFDRYGWFKTGDFVYFDENQCIYVVDRIKEVILYNLYNISPSVIEDILSKHPAVSECFVMGIPHPTDNEHPMGVVVLDELYKKKIEPNEIVDFVNSKVPSDRYKIRGGIVFLEEMIKGPTGKLKKLVMKREIIEKLGGGSGDGRPSILNYKNGFNE